ncbi:MAG: response regulator transcription factor [Actinobacteria bacterium]|nr:response regulator transcription factor [Actinomycetota bacterium]
MGSGSHNEAVTTILVVDDEPVVRDVVVKYLARDGFATMEASTGDDARALIEEREPTLVVLDVMLPGTDGLELCRWIRSRGDLPVILLTARVEETDRIVGLELGADDYVTKPFSPRELVARVRAVLRRPRDEQPRQRTIDVGDLTIDAGTRRVARNGEEIALTAKEFELLWFLAANRGLVFSRETLMDRIWGYQSVVDTGTVTVHVRRLREKIEADPSSPVHLQTVWGVGYRFAE